MRTCDKCPCDEFAKERKFFCTVLDRKIYRRQAELCRLDNDYRLHYSGGGTSSSVIVITSDELTEAAERFAAEIGEPTIVEKGKHFLMALARWRKAGYPCRTDEQVAHIYRDHCKPCGFRDSKADTCKLCSCPVRIVGIAVRNKLRMATESCPRWKW